jgi:hypothetical protein
LFLLRPSPFSGPVPCEEENAVRSIVQANSASPHFVGAAASFSTKDKEPMEQVSTNNKLVFTFTSSDSEDESPKKKHWLFNCSSDEEETQFTAADIFGSDSSDSSEEESLQRNCCSKNLRRRTSAALAAITLTRPALTMTARAWAGVCKRPRLPFWPCSLAEAMDNDDADDLLHRAGKAELIQKFKDVRP